LYKRTHQLNNYQQFDRLLLVNIPYELKSEVDIMLNIQTPSNDLVAASTFLTDNRQKNENADTMWDKLNFSQQYAVCSLGQFGYLLSYVRTVGDSSLAILKQDSKIATINESGIININPAIICRK